MGDGKLISSPSSKLIGAQAAVYDKADDVVTMRFTAPESFSSPRGVVQGGLVCGFLDEVMGAAALMKSGGAKLPLNLDITMSFMKPVPVGPINGRGRVIKMGRNVAYLEGELFDDEGNLLARSTSTAMLTEVKNGKA